MESERPAIFDDWSWTPSPWWRPIKRRRARKRRERHRQRVMEWWQTQGWRFPR